MKTLQSNFTTLEQSKRLLELGVPAGSADCVWHNPYYDGERPELAEIYVWKGKYPQRVDKYTLPCWSVGRLMKICKICETKKDYMRLCDELKECQDYCVLIVSHIIANLPTIDFSKLEEYYV